jgi:diadenosine tetraphosphate (Ap4A) HIT family hydrolase
MAGKDCTMCRSTATADNGFGVRILEGEYADVYLQRRTPLPGYCIAIWKQDHVAEADDLDAVTASGYWNEVMRAGRAIRMLFEPAKLNYLTLGNAVPHLHTHILPRYIGDPAPGRPLPWELVESAPPIPEGEFERQCRELGRLTNSF